jgi:hypothetical protein
MEEFLLKVTEDQDALSKKILSEPIKEIAESILDGVASGTLISEVEGAPEEEEDEPSYDIHLRESARIMADWLQALDKAKTVSASTK